MKKIKIFASIITICLALGTLAYGVYAANNLSFDISANVNFVVNNLFVDVQSFNITGAYYTHTDNLQYAVDFGADFTYTTDTSKNEAGNQADLISEFNEWLGGNATLTRTGSSDVTLTRSTVLGYGQTKGIQFCSTKIVPLEIKCQLVNKTPSKRFKATINEGTITEGVFTTAGYTSPFTTTNSVTYANVGLAYEYDTDYNAQDYSATIIRSYRLKDLTTAIPATNLYWQIAVEEDISTVSNIGGATTEGGAVLSSINAGTNDVLFIPREITVDDVSRTVVAIGAPSSTSSIFVANSSNVKYIKIPYRVTVINQYAFSGISATHRNIEYVEMSNATTTIGAYAFAYCNLQAIDIPATVNVPDIGSYAFAFNSTLKQAKFNYPNNYEPGNSDIRVFYGCGSVVTDIATSLLKIYVRTIPASFGSDFWLYYDNGENSLEYTMEHVVIYQ